MVLKPQPDSILSEFDRLQRYNLAEQWRICLDRLKNHISLSDLDRSSELQSAIAACNNAGVADLSGSILHLFDISSRMLAGDSAPDVYMTPSGGSAAQWASQLELRKDHMIRVRHAYDFDAWASTGTNFIGTSAVAAMIQSIKQDLPHGCEVEVMYPQSLDSLRAALEVDIEMSRISQDSAVCIALGTVFHTHCYWLWQKGRRVRRRTPPRFIMQHVWLPMINYVFTTPIYSSHYNVYAHCP